MNVSSMHTVYHRGSGVGQKGEAIADVAKLTVMVKVSYLDTISGYKVDGEGISACLLRPRAHSSDFHDLTVRG